MQATLYTNISPKFKFQKAPKQRYNKNHKTENKTQDIKKLSKNTLNNKMREKKRKTKEYLTD